MEKQRDHFSSKIGFVLAAAGSAVGLGNLWRFPYLAAQYGGGIFLFVYLILAVTFGFALMVTEIALGRKTQLSVVGAYKKLNKRFAFLGYLAALVPMLILPYYSVIGGWVIKYFSSYVIGHSAAMAEDSYFSGFISQAGQPIIWLVIFVVITCGIVMLGVQKGIEQVSKFMMPALVVLTIGIAVYVMTIPGAMKGVLYYITPDFGKFSIKTVLAALGQLFYSMSLAMGIMITYGSYMKKENNLETSVRQIELFDTGIAFLSGLMIVPAVFAFSGGSEAAMQSGPSLMFVTLPKVFEQTGVGIVLGIVFFLLVFFAALTSAISLMETVVSFFEDKFHWNRRVVCLCVAGGVIALGIPSALGYGVLEAVTILGKPILDFFDFITNSVLMPTVALLTSLFVGFVIKPQTIIDEVRISSKFREAKMYSIIIRFIAPVCLAAILITSILDAFGIFKL